MKYSRATVGSRFLSFVVDIFIVTILSTIILSFMINLFLKESSMLFTSLLEQYVTQLNMGADVTKTYNELIAVMKPLAGYTLLSMLIVWIPYFCILPYFWSKQTVGRKLLHLQVVSVRTEAKPSIYSIFARELIGGYLLLMVLSSFLLFPVVLNLVFCIFYGKSMADIVGGTLLVDVRYQNQPHPQDNFESHNEYVDASFKEVEEERQTDKEEDVEYHIF